MSSPPAVPQNGKDTITTEQSQDSPPISPASTLEKDSTVELQPEKSLSSPHPMRKYTRKQLIFLSDSPLVKPPPNMPELKAWFGSESENAVKKDDPPTPNAARERRGFRRDADDGDAPRPSFRSALTQTSQMGNFKHQSLRVNDRGDGETQSLRNASEKYDRDKLAQPTTGSRTKERDPAPHLGASSVRATVQPLSSNAASRRAETRETTKKKVGEASEDWRRGAEPPRTAREDRADNGKREDRTRSRVDDSSGNKRDSSTSHKERDHPERERGSRGDDSRREKDDSRRDRDLESEDDPRRWKDDGKRDERLAARRDRGRDKVTDDHKWEGTTERRWAAGDDKDSRYKRATGRERKVNPDDGKDDRRDREREREKEPAWMDTYVPTNSSPGILGGQSSTGELDGIQAWKKGLKEKESKDKEASVPARLKSSGSAAEQAVTSSITANADKPLDEIQLFKLLMKKEQEAKRPDTVNGLEPTSRTTTSDAPGFSPQQRQRNLAPDVVAAVSSSSVLINAEHSQYHLKSATAESITESVSSAKIPPNAEPSQGPSTSLSRIISSSPETQGNPTKQSGERISSPSFQPPPGSRLLAFARVPPKAAIPPIIAPLNNSQPLNGGLQNLLSEQNQNQAKTEPVRPPSGFSPFEEQMRQSYAFDEAREFQNQSHINHRPSMDSGFGSHPEQNYNNMAAGKGSRFAKFFDGKSRDGTPAGKPPGPGIPLSTSPLQSQRPDQANFGGITPNAGDQRAMDELFAMLSNSSHQRGSLSHPSNVTPLMGNGGGFNAPGPNLHALQQHHLQQQQQQQQQQQHQHQQHQQHQQQQQQHLLQQNHLNNRLESLYDSRNDDRSFVPDGMVPGLRPLPPPPRGRENVGHFPEQLEEPLHYNMQRIAQQQQQQGRNVDPLYAGPVPPIFAQQSARHNALPLQSLQPQYRGGPSPGLNQVNSIVNVQQQQRLPPGLANLGGRPPHEPAQFIGLQGHPSGNPHNPLHSNAPLSQQQLPFNNFNVGNNVGFNGSQVRGPGPASHLLNNAQQHPLGNLGHPNMDPRLANHHHLMGLGGSGVGGNRINGGFPQQGPPAPSHIPMRPQQQQQQQQPHLLPHMLPHLLPPHLPQQGHPSSNSQQAHDLMALLMGGPQHRE